MEFSLTLALNIAAVVVMLYCLWSVIYQKKNIPGGKIGAKWNILTGLVIFFSLGYLAMPFFSEISPEILRLIISAVFFFGAIYVLITINLLRSIIRVLVR